MSIIFDNTEVDNPPVYKKGDIVWVKLSGYWWPGEVKNEEDLPSDLLTDFKKPPLVIVKFFEEDSYEYIKQWSNIYPYECDKKNEFIKKGMGGFRAKLSHMLTFPRDVTTAEERTNGDPNILSQPEFLPNKKINYDEIFGTPSPKKSARGKTVPTKKATSKDATKPLVTHRRFLGNDDYKSYILIQEPCKDRQPTEEDEEIRKLDEEPTEILRCEACDFTTVRLGVLLIHNKLHLEGNVYVTAKRKNKKPKDTDSNISESNVPENVVAKTTKPRKIKVIQPKSKPNIDVFSNLLNEWDDSDEDMETPVKQRKSNNSKVSHTVTDSTLNNDDHSNLLNSQEEGLILDSVTVEVISTDNVQSAEPNKNTQEDIKNCFDFDEEEEEDGFLYPASTGRKIPRVIPEKPRASISELLELGDKEDEQSKSKPDKQQAESNSVPDEDDTRKKEILRVSQSFNRTPMVDKALDNTFKDLMEETEVPVLDDLTHSLKSEQNFHDARTIKFPDKGGTTLKTPVKSGTSKKKFVTSFEDFEAGFRKVDVKPSKEIQAKDVNSNSEAEKTGCSKDDAAEEVITDNLSTEHKEISTETTLKTPTRTEKTSGVKKRRKFKQLIIEEDSEKLVEYYKEENDNVSSFSKINQESLIDPELAGIKLDLASPDTKSDSLKESQNHAELSLEELTRDLEGSNTSLDIVSKDEASAVENSVKSNTNLSTVEDTQCESSNRRSIRLRGPSAPETLEASIVTEVKKSKNRRVSRKDSETKSSQSDVESVTKESSQRKKDGSRSRKNSEKQVSQETSVPVVQNFISEDLEKPPLRRGRSRKSDTEIREATSPITNPTKIDEVNVNAPTASISLAVKSVPNEEKISPKSRKKSRRKLSSSNPMSNFKEVEHEDGRKTRSQKHRKIEDENACLDASLENVTQITQAQPESSTGLPISLDEEKQPVNEENIINQVVETSEAAIGKVQHVASKTKVLNIPDSKNSKLSPTEKDHISFDVTPNAEVLDAPDTENRKLDATEKSDLSVKSAGKGRITRSSIVSKKTAEPVIVEKSAADVSPSPHFEEMIIPKKRRGRSQRFNESSDHSTTTHALPISEKIYNTENTDELGQSLKSSDVEPKQEISSSHVTVDVKTDELGRSLKSCDVESKQEIDSSHVTADMDGGTNPNTEVAVPTKDIQLFCQAVRSEQPSCLPEEVITPKRRRGRSQRLIETVDNSTTIPESNIQEKNSNSENIGQPSQLTETSVESKQDLDSGHVSRDVEASFKEEVSAQIGDTLLPVHSELSELLQPSTALTESVSKLTSEENQTITTSTSTAEQASSETIQVEDANSTITPAEILTVPLEDIPLPEEPKQEDEEEEESPKEIAMLDIPVEDIPLPPSPPPEVQKHSEEPLGVTTIFPHQKSVDFIGAVIVEEDNTLAKPKEENTLNNVNPEPLDREGEGKEQHNKIGIINSTDNSIEIELESIPVPESVEESEMGQKEQPEQAEEKVKAFPVESKQDVSIAFSLEDIPIPEPINPPACESHLDTTFSNQSVQSTETENLVHHSMELNDDILKSLQKTSEEVEMSSFIQESEQYTECSTTFNLDDIPIPSPAPKDKESPIKSTDVSFADDSLSNDQENCSSEQTLFNEVNSAQISDAPISTTEHQVESEFINKPAQQNSTVTTHKSCDDSIEKNQSNTQPEILNDDKTQQDSGKPQNTGIVCDTIYSQQPEVRRSGRMKISRRRWDVSEPTESSETGSRCQPQDTLNIHTTPQSQTETNSDLKTEAEQAKSSESWTSTVTTATENVSNDSLDQVIENSAFSVTFDALNSEESHSQSTSSTSANELTIDSTKIVERSEKRRFKQFNKGIDQSKAVADESKLKLENSLCGFAVNVKRTLQTETMESSDLMAPDLEDSSSPEGAVKSNERGRLGKQVLGAQNQPAVKFTSNSNTEVEDAKDKKYEKISGEISESTTEIQSCEKERKSPEKRKETAENNRHSPISFSLRKRRSSKHTQPLDHFKSLFDDEELTTSQSRLDLNFKDSFYGSEVASADVASENKTSPTFSEPTTESEIILPLKKSKRVNEISSMLSHSFTSNADSEFSFRSTAEDSFLSTSMRNHIDRLINEMDSVDTSGIETLTSSSLDGHMFSHISAADKSQVVEPSVPENLSECRSVPPKKKKIDVIQDELQTDDKRVGSVPHAPKKKIQKLFERSKSPGKSVEVPLMSPLAKKKSFYFQHDFEKFEQSLLAKDNLASLSSSEDSNADESLDSLPSVSKPKLSVELDHSRIKEQLEKPHDQNTDDLCDTNKSTIETPDPTPIPDAKVDQQTILTDKKRGLDLAEHVAEELVVPESKTENANLQPEKPLEGESNLDQATTDLELKEQKFEVKVSAPTEPELIPITVAPTVMSEKDLDDAQVEITSDVVISEKKPSSLGAFSVNFDTAIVTKTENLTTVKVESPKTSDTAGTEFTSKAMIKEFDNKSLTSQPNTYALKSELLDILEGNSNSSTNSSGSEQKFKTSFDNYDKKNTVQGIIDFEDAIPPQIVITNKINTDSVLLDSPKLLERLSMSSVDAEVKLKQKSVTEVKPFETVPKTLPSKIAKSAGLPKPGQKILIRTSKSMIATSSKTAASKPIILSEQIIRRAGAAASSIPKGGAQGVKREYEDVEDVEAAFIIPKIAKKLVEEETASSTPLQKPTKSRGSKAGKPKILQQTIISPKGDVVPHKATATAKQSVQLQNVPGQHTRDDTVFDINSMPIVLSDDLLTPESIQNMPVVLSDEMVTHTATVPSTKSQEKLTTTIPKKTIVSTIGTKQIIFKTTQPSSIPLSTNKQATKLKSVPVSVSAAIQTKLAQGGTTAFIATGTTPDGKTAKYVLVPPSVNPSSSQVMAIKKNVITKQPVVQPKPAAVGIAATSNAAQVVGNKIMIVTNAQGQQTRLVLTPQQQKVFMPTVGKTKTLIKGAIPKTLLESATGSSIAGPSGVTAKTSPILSQGATSTQPKTIISSSLPTVTNATGLLMPAVKNVKSAVPTKKVTQKSSKPHKTILIKNQLGQTVKKIQGTNNADLDRQVAEQLQAIKASARLQQANKSPEFINFTNRCIPNTLPSNRAAIKKTFGKKIEGVKSKVFGQASVDDAEKKQDTVVPALSPLSPQSRIPQVTSQPTQIISKASTLKRETSRIPTSRIPDQGTPTQTASLQKSTCRTAALPTAKTDKPTENKRPESPVRQVVIQDGLGNLTTVTVGQILAIPSETVDGQPQSYMLVTVDESGNLTPLNNDALMSLDPSLGIGGDLSNVVLQVDQGQGTVATVKSTAAECIPPVPVLPKSKVEERLKSEKPKSTPQPSSHSKPVLTGVPKPREVPVAVEQQVVVGEGVVPGDTGGQQLIVTGDPVATQKFLESLSDGSTDLAAILAKAEGGSVLIQTEGQQILIRTNTDSQPVLGISDSELLASHKPNQDILAAALANTDVFQSTEQGIINQSIVKGVSPAQLSPGTGGGLFPMQVGNVLETSLTLSSPIMTPLEVPSTNSKKIGDEADVLGQVPKNVDLPITITDPNISQTVAHAPALMELSLPIPDSGSSQDINSPSFPYSLTTIEESVSMSQKSFNGSMPLLTEDVIEHRNVTSPSSDKCLLEKDSSSNFSTNFESLPLLDTIGTSKEDSKGSTFGNIGSLPMLSDDVVEDSGSSMGSSKLPRSSPKPMERDIVDEGLSTLGGEMCSSLSEPPPDMFDLSSLAPKEEEVSSDLSSIPEPETLSINSENSNEIPLQPPIVASLSDLKRPSDDDSESSDEKRPRFDD